MGIKDIRLTPGKLELPIGANHAEVAGAWGAHLLHCPSLLDVKPHVNSVLVIQYLNNETLSKLTGRWITFPVLICEMMFI